MILPTTLPIDVLLIVSSLAVIAAMMIKGIISIINESGPASFLWHE